MAMQLNPQALSGLSGIARRLVVDGVLADEDARRASDAAAKQKIPLVSFLVQNNLAQASQVASAASVGGEPCASIS